MIRSCCITFMLLGIAPALHAQGLGARVARIESGEVRLSFAARPGVCGDGRTFIGDASAPEGFRIYFWGAERFGTGTSPHFQEDCLPGPVRVSLHKAAGGVTEVRLYVGGAWRGSGHDLGTVGAADAASYLLDVARTASDRVTGTAILAASLADSVRLTPRLIAMGRDRDLQAQVRERALRWLPDVAEREDALDAAEQALRAVAADGADIRSVRERALRSLPESQANETFLRNLYARLDATSLKDRVIRRLGEVASPENATWLHQRALDASEPVALRDRAIRVLGSELGERDLLRQIYGRLTETSLRDRIIRVLGESGTAEDNAWLRTVAADESEHPELRSRAIRVWAEAGATTADLIRAYQTAKARAIRERLIRIFAERSDQASLDQLVAVAKSDPDESLRRFAVKRLAETGDPRGRGFPETTVKR